jgi:type II secretory pathway pseudopilin PulG
MTIALRHSARAAGFTLLEVVLTLLLLGTLAGVLVSTYWSAEDDTSSQESVVKAHVRYAQSMAMNNDKYWGIQFAGSTYVFFNDVNSPMRLPGEDADTVSLPSAMNSVSVTLGFDEKGMPYTKNSAGDWVAVSSDLQISANTGVWSLSVTPYTGYIP